MSSNKLKVTTNALANSRIAVQLEVPAAKCKTTYEETLSRLSKTADLPGFRKGKVPKAVILQQLGIARIKASTLEKLLQRAWEEALDQESIEPLCEPELKNGFDALLQDFNPDKKLSITLETDIAPIPKLKASKGLTVEAEKVEFDPKKVDELIEQSRKQLATLIPVEKRSAEMGDIAVVSFEGTYKDDGSEITGGSSDSMDVELENGRMIPGFIEGIVGMSINQTKSLECQFPKDYQDEKSQGRAAKFVVTLKDLKTRELPELDDSFAKQASDKNTMNDLREDLENRLKEETKRTQLKKRQESLINGLVQELEVELPNSLIELEIRNIIEQTARNFAQQGIDVKSIFTPELIDSLRKSSRKEAEENLRKNLALNALSKKENIEINESELEEKLKEVRNELSKEKNIDENKLKQAVSDDLLQEKLLLWLEENNTVIEKAPEKEVKANKNISKSEKTSKSSKKTEPKAKKTPKSENQ
tara:strand:+ start:46185 stop:47612 length:1428 start_codon:yes stop_codon:yes gene_type:complete